MGTHTKIEWAHHTWNPWRGCTHATLPDGSEHPGCANCYAEALSRRNPAVLGKWGTGNAGGVRVVGDDRHWALPYHWDRAAAKAGERRRVFFSLGDPFEEFTGHVLSHRGEVIADCRDCGFSYVIRSGDHGGCCGYCRSGAITVGSLAGTRRRMFAIIDRCQHLDFILLTKRPQNVRDMWPARQGASDDPKRANVWLGTSISTQHDADLLLPHLISCRNLAGRLVVSAEPLLNPLSLEYHLPAIDWLIIGGESGRKARPCDLTWVDDLIRQAQDAKASCFVKQLGSRTVHHGRPVPLRHAKGGDPQEWPEDLRVQEVCGE